MWDVSSLRVMWSELEKMTVRLARRAVALYRMKCMVSGGDIIKLATELPCTQVKGVSCPHANQRYGYHRRQSEHSKSNVDNGTE